MMLPSFRAAPLATALLLLAAAGPMHAQRTATPPASPVQAAQPLRTAAEESEFTAYTSHDDMMGYLHRLQATSAEMRVGSYGESREGRTLPYAVFSRPTVTTPQEAALLGKPVVVLAANVHGGERTLRESLLILTRDIATKGTAANALLDDLIIIVAPQINPDGFSATDRGTRGNLWGIDLNRDYIKLEHPEIAAYVGNLINRWGAHIFVDGHNGGSAPYNLNYQCGSHGDPDQRITLLCDREIFPAIDARLARQNYSAFFYTGGNERRWNTGGFEARIGRNYGSFANAIGILFESVPRQSMADGVKSGILGYSAVLEYAQKNRAKVLSVVNTARRETIEMGDAPRGDIVVQMRYGPEDYPVTYRIMRPGPDSVMRAVTVRSDSLMKKPVTLKTRPRPYAYVLPREATAAVAMLRRHGITVEQLDAPLTTDVTAYVAGDITYEQAYNHAAAVRVTVDTTVQMRETFPKGSYVVRTGQVLGRVVAHMLEPETSDNVIYWNTMDAWLPKPALARVTAAPGVAGADADPDEPQAQRGPARPPIIPIYKIMRPVAIVGTMVK